LKKGESRNYWPHFIVGSIIAVFGLCVWTIKVANSLPVEVDDFYFDSYYNVNQNINKIKLQEIEFDKRYDVDLLNEKLNIGKNSIEIKLTSKSGDGIDDANISVLITRPLTSKFDKRLKTTDVESGRYSFEAFEIEQNQLGRWQVKSKITIGDLTAFKVFEVNATK
jgi:hypothetical protein